MSKFAVDLSGLEQKIYKRAFKLEDVKDQIEKVGFDVVRFKDNDKGAELWQVHSADDGDYIVAMYKDDIEKEALAWEVAISKTASDLQVYYKGDPIVKVASEKLGIPATELNKVIQYLPKKLAESKKLVKALLNELPESAKNSVLNKYPELA
jgi:hypothetical protein